MFLNGYIVSCRGQLTNCFKPNSYKRYTGFAGLKETDVFSSMKENAAAPLHKTAVTTYPAAAQIPLPTNIEDIEDSEKARFSPQRSRDISGPVIMAKSVPLNWNKNVNEQYNNSDPHVGSYDCNGSVSLSSVMQTNVPQPFSSCGKSTYLNMPGGQWGQGDKYVAEDLRSSHFSNSAQKHPTKGGSYRKTGTFLSQMHFGSLWCNRVLYPTLLNPKRKLNTQSFLVLSPNGSMLSHRYCTTNQNAKPLSRKEKLKQAVKDYGATVIVFHVGISLLSLGGFYLAVSSGIDMGAILHKFGAGNVAVGASTFVVAYAVHKVFAPARIAITLTVTPFIVRYLRRIGILKTKS